MFYTGVERESPPRDAKDEDRVGCTFPGLLSLRRAPRGRAGWGSRRDGQGGGGGRSFCGNLGNLGRGKRSEDLLG